MIKLHMSTWRIVEHPQPRKSPRVHGAPKSHPASWILVLLVTDVTLFVVACILGAFAGFTKWNSPAVVHDLIIADSFFVVLWIVIFDRLGLYRRTYALSMKDELYYTVAALCLGTVPQFVLFTIFPYISTSRAALLYSLAFSIVLVGPARAVLHRVRASRTFNRHRRTTIVGTSSRIAAVAESLEVASNLETQMIVVDDIDATVSNIDLSRDADLECIEWFTRARAWGSEVLILTEILPPGIVAHLLEVAARERMQIAFAPPRITRYAYDLSISSDGHQALIIPSRLRACTPRAQLFKRIVDVTLGSIALVIFSPIMIVAALAVYLDSGSPVMFKQERVGLGGRVFEIYKFRSMRADAECESGAVWAREDDPRKTRIGGILRRFSLDEFPQLFNVLRGEMSLVGPRPERPVFVELFRTTLPRYDERHLIRPGITGWSQVHMKRILEPSAAAEKLEYDLQYLENWSLFLDVSVLFQTAVEFLFHRAA
jgi:exopolysaccharide biosynthesis polyprenyl glycosylphosphotransferase